MRSSTAGLLLTLLAIGATGLAVWALAAPSTLPADAPAELFSAERAAVHLEAIAREPRPVGSPAHAAAREYIQEQIRALGLKPQVQTATARWPGPSEGWGTFATVRNIYVRLRGERQSRPLVIATHYDTVTNSPGAGDAGVGVATLLETMRALTVKPPLNTDVVFLFTDAEELGLRGAERFMDEIPLAEKIKMVINLDARGTGGPTLVYETSDGNSPLVRELVGAGRSPASFSFSQEVYRKLPFTTDFSVLARGGTAGYNLGFFAGPTAYHTALDNLENVSLRSMQQGGETTLSLVHHVDEAGIGSEWQGEDTVHFSLLGRSLISFPKNLALMLAVAMVVAVTVLLVLGVARGRLALGRCLVAALAMAAAACTLGLVARWTIEFLIVPRYRFQLWLGVNSHSWVLIAFVLLTTALLLLFARWLGARVGAVELSIGGLTLWAVVTLIACVRAPGASYLFTLPLLIAVPAGIFQVFGQEDSETRLRPLRFLALAGTVFVAAVLWAPALVISAMAINRYSTFWVVGGVAVLLGGLLASATLMAGAKRTGTGLAALLLIAGVALATAVPIASKFGPENPRHSSLIYALDADAGEANWLTFDSEPSPWSAQFLGEEPARAPFPRVMNHEAPIPHAAAPLLDDATRTRRTATVEVVEERYNPAQRSVDLRVDWPEEPHRAILAFLTSGRVRALTINGNEVESVENATPGSSFRTLVRYYAPPEEGLEISADLLPATASLRVEVLGDWHELPVLDGRPIPERPPELYPANGLMVDSTLIYSAVEIPFGSASTAAQ